MPRSGRGAKLGGAWKAILKDQGSVGGSAAKRGIAKPLVRTGVLGLDIALGGGFPIGSSVLFWGEPKSGKTTSAHHIVAALQRVCRRCLRVARDVTTVPPESGDENDRWEAEGYCDCIARGLSRMPDPPPRDKVESAKEFRKRCEEWAAEWEDNSYEEFVVAWFDTEEDYDAGWAERKGVDPRRVLLVTPSTAERVSDAAVEIIWSGGVDLCVIDSLAQMTPLKEIEESAAQDQQGLAARKLNKMFRRIISGGIEVRNENNKNGIPHGVSNLWINQKREKIGVSYGDPSVTPGGLGQGFAVKVELRFLTPEIEVRDVKFAGSTATAYKEAVAEKIRPRVLKNKLATGLYKLTTEFTQSCVERDGLRPGDVDDSKYIYNLAAHHGAIEKRGKAGPYFIVPADVEVKTQKEAKDLLRSDFTVRSAVEAHIIRKMTHRG